MARLRHKFIVLHRPDWSWAILRTDKIRSARPNGKGSVVDYFHRQDWSYREHEVRESITQIKWEED